MTEPVPIALVSILLLTLLYLGVWSWWVLPRLVVLRREALIARYHVPGALWGALLVAEAVAPLTAVVVAALWVRGRCASWWSRYV